MLLTLHESLITNAVGCWSRPFQSCIREPGPRSVLNGLKLHHSAEIPWHLCRRGEHDASFWRKAAPTLIPFALVRRALDHTVPNSQDRASLRAVDKQALEKEEHCIGG